MMLKFIIALIVTIVLGVAGLEMDAKWRIKLKKEPDLPKVIRRQFSKGKAGIVGIGILPTPFLLAFGLYKLALIFLGFSAVMLILVTLAFLFSKITLKMVGVYVLAGVGAVTRAFFTLSIIGIPILHHLDLKAEVGIEGYMKIMAEMAKRDNRNSNPNIRVWRRDFLGFKEYLKVSEDGKQYQDPDNGCWKDVADLTED